MFVSVLSSGSKGNSTLFTYRDQLILIDNGLSGKELFCRMEQIEQHPENLSGIVITHDHTDHVKGVGILARKLKIPIYIHEKNYINKQKLFDKCEIIMIDNHFSIGHFNLQPFEIPHDGSANYAYNIEAGGKKVSLVTDLGMATTLVKQKITGCDLLILESNHDPKLLKESSYPWELKQRIAGRHGHLSNQDACKLTAELEHENLHTIILAHLSEENNDPFIAKDLMQKNLVENNKNYRIMLADQYKPLELLKV